MTRFEPGSFDNATLVEVIRVNESLDDAEQMLRDELARLREGLETQRLLADRRPDPQAARSALRAQVAAIEDREEALEQLAALRAQQQKAIDAAQQTDSAGGLTGEDRDIENICREDLCAEQEEDLA